MGKQKRLERKSFELKLDGPPDDEGRFTGYAAVFGNVDHGNDVIEPGAFTKTLQEKPQVPILWAHNPDKPIGVSTSMTEDGKGLKVEGQLAMEVQCAREVHALMKLGAIKGLSIGYNTVRRQFKGSVRHLQEVALGEFSPVVFPMNDRAEVDAVKDLYGYERTELVGCLLSMIQRGADYLVAKIAMGDTENAERMNTVLGELAKLLEAEMGRLAAEAGDDEDAVKTAYKDVMGKALAPAMSRLEGLAAEADTTVGLFDSESDEFERELSDFLESLRSN